jgi:hypothetical protein
LFEIGCWSTTKYSFYSSSAVALKYRRKLPKGLLKMSKVSPELFEQILTPEMKTLASLFEKHGFELRMAGGAVRYKSLVN